MAYKITITEQESGKKIVDDEKCNAIIGAISNEQGVRSVSYIKANAGVVALTANNIIKVIEQLKRENEVLDILMKYWRDLKNEN